MKKGAAVGIGIGIAVIIIALAVLGMTGNDTEKIEEPETSESVEESVVPVGKDLSVTLSESVGVVGNP